MIKLNSYYILIFIVIILLSNIQLTSLKPSEIKLVFKGKGEQEILNSLFPYEPSEVIVNGYLKESCKKYYYLELENNNEVIIKFMTQIKTCENMFNGLINLIEADLSNFDASKVTNMFNMFFSCTGLKKVNFGDIDTSSVKSIQSIFKECNELTFIDMSKFNTNNLENMLDVFAYCRKLIAVKMQNFDTSKTTTMRGIFCECNDLIYADLSNFQTSLLSDISYMFAECRSLIYIDLSSFIIHNNSIDITDHFRQVNTGVNICIRDDTTRNFLLDTRDDCYHECFKQNIKIDLSQRKCIDNCNECSNKYEYYNLCFDKCPENTYPINNKFLCLDKKPKGYYLCNGKYNTCYETCEDCNKKGNQIYNNCIECKNGYKFLDDSMYNSNGNCYGICNGYFYFDEFNNYQCVDICPEKYNKKINEKNKCINECKYDDTYMYEYNSFCYKNCPNESCLLYNYYCIDKLINNQNIYFELIKNKVIKCLNIEELNEGNDLIFLNQEVIYTISTTTSNQKNNIIKKDISAVNLGNCINKLKDKYNISKDEEENLYILKIDIPLEGIKIPKIEYEVYYPLYNETLFQLDLSICHNTLINISIPINISFNDLDLYNSSSSLYNDICYTLTSDSGTDKSLKDRRNEFIDKNLTICEENCKFIDYDNITKRAICSCYTKINLPIILNYAANTFQKSLDICYGKIPPYPSPLHSKITTV